MGKTEKRRGAQGLKNAPHSLCCFIYEELEGLWRTGESRLCKSTEGRGGLTAWLGWGGALLPDIWLWFVQTFMYQWFSCTGTMCSFKGMIQGKRVLWSMCIHFFPQHSYQHFNHFLVSISLFMKRFNTWGRFVFSSFNCSSHSGNVFRNDHTASFLCSIFAG